jgi:hypothetical protein
MTKVVLGALLATVFLAPPRPAPAPRPPPRPTVPIPALPVVTRVHVDAGKDATIVIEELTFARGEWQSGDVDAFVAFGAPGVPRAFDAHLLSSDPALGGADPADVGEPIVGERAPRRPASARTLVGRDGAAGEVLHLREASLRRAFARANGATVRLRSLLGPIAPDAGGGREVLVRLGTFGATPITLGRVEVAALDGHPFAAPAQARLCGDGADPYPIAVQLSPARPLANVVTWPAPTAPALVARRPTDELCIRFFVP